MNGIDAAAIDTLLPQTQCMRCGYAGCRPYAEALAAGRRRLNRCPPGGAQLIAQLAALLGRPPLPLDPACGTEAPPRVAEIVIAACIGCARCLPACPVDAIIGARRQLHTVLPDWCTGCELCLPACPVDCIRMPERGLSGPTASPAAGAEPRSIPAAPAAPQQQRSRRSEDPVTPAARQRFYAALQAANPQPRTELEYGSTFQLLVAVILSAQATDRSVNAATRGCSVCAPTPQAMLALGLAGLKRHIRTIGLFNSKAKHILATARRWSNATAAMCPASARRWKRCPGSGARPRTSCSIPPSASRPSRSTRTSSASPTAPASRRGRRRARWRPQLVAARQREFLHDAHHWLILHGRYVCKARRPDCPRCPVARWCAWPDKSSA